MSVKKNIILVPLLMLLFSFVIAESSYAATSQGALIKLSCPSGAGLNNPCRAVYFYGHDNKRHVFPNEKTLLTWYPANYAVSTVDAVFLSSLPLGSNITYHPGYKMVKFETDPKVYVVALGGELRGLDNENVAAALYGLDWSKKIDDVSDAFFSDYHFGLPVVTTADYNPNDELQATPSIDYDLAMTYQRKTLATAGGNFDIHLTILQREKFAMRTSTAEDSDCFSDCPAISLKDHAARFGASVGIHGSYFCPPDYAQCSSEVNTFLPPFYDSLQNVMNNEYKLQHHNGPLISYAADKAYRFFRPAKTFGNTVVDFENTYKTKLEAVASNYPTLLYQGEKVVLQESTLDENMKTLKGVRGGFGMNNNFIFLAIARSATVVDMADIMKTLGATDAFNLDGGGSAAMIFDNNYVFGPGRLLPNAIMFVPVQ